MLRHVDRGIGHNWKCSDDGKRPPIVSTRVSERSGLWREARWKRIIRVVPKTSAYQLHDRRVPRVASEFDPAGKSRLQCQRNGWRRPRRETRLVSRKLNAWGVWHSDAPKASATTAGAHPRRYISFDLHQTENGKTPAMRRDKRHKTLPPRVARLGRGTKWRRRLPRPACFERKVHGD